MHENNLHIHNNMKVYIHFMLIYQYRRPLIYFVFAAKDQINTIYESNAISADEIYQLEIDSVKEDKVGNSKINSDIYLAILIVL